MPTLLTNTLPFPLVLFPSLNQPQGLFPQHRPNYVKQYINHQYLDLNCGRGGGADPQSVVSSQIYLRSAYDVKAYVLFIAIRPFEGEVKPDCSLGVFKRVGSCRH